MSELKRYMNLFTEIDSETADKVVSWISDHNERDEFKSITLNINSNGGSIYHGMAIINAMQFSSVDVKTVCYANASSMAAHVFVAGAHRTMFKNSSLLFHSSIVADGQYPVEQAEANMADLKVVDDYLSGQIADGSNMTKRRFKKEFCTPINRYVYSDEAKALGLCEYVINLGGK
jgi:ATP-dependent Clp protease protease subunit